MEKTETKVLENESKDKILSIQCLECKRPTRHRVMVSFDKKGTASDDTEGWNVDWSDSYQVLECQGCETITFRHENWFSEAEDFDYDGITERLYPMRNKEA